MNDEKRTFGVNPLDVVDVSVEWKVLGVALITGRRSMNNLKRFLNG
jgi:hypothetical protein